MRPKDSVRHHVRESIFETVIPQVVGLPRTLLRTERAGQWAKPLLTDVAKWLGGHSLKESCSDSKKLRPRGSLCTLWKKCWLLGTVSGQISSQFGLFTPKLVVYYNRYLNKLIL